MVVNYAPCVKLHSVSGMHEQKISYDCNVLWNILHWLTTLSRARLYCIDMPTLDHTRLHCSLEYGADMGQDL